MEGEFDKECAEYGGCPPNMVLLSVGDQWERIRGEIEKGLDKSSRKKEMKKVDAKWKELQERQEVPALTDKRSLLSFLKQLVEAAVADIEKHKQNEKKGVLTKRGWNKELEEKEEHRRVVNQMKVTCVDLQVEDRRKRLQKQSEKTHPPMQPKGLNSAWPSAPEKEDPPTHDLYPDLSPRPPPYHGNSPPIQAPVMQITEGLVTLQELQGEQLERAKEYLREEAQRHLTKLEDRVRRWTESKNEGRLGNDWGSPAHTPTPQGAAGGSTPAHSINPSIERENGAQEEIYMRDDMSDGSANNPFEPEMRRCEEAERRKRADREYDLLLDWAPEGHQADDKLSLAAEMVGQLTIHNPRAGHGAGGPGHDYNLRTRKGGFEENLMMPLITKSGGNKVYQPFSFTDMGCILDKMPKGEARG